MYHSDALKSNIYSKRRSPYLHNNQNESNYTGNLKEKRSTSNHIQRRMGLLPKPTHDAITHISRFDMQYPENCKKEFGNQKEINTQNNAFNSQSELVPFLEQALRLARRV